MVQFPTFTWNGPRREADGLELISEDGGATWIIVAPHGEGRISGCPHCGKPFLLRGAQLIADFAYPPES
jgi:hypothetical protein